MGSTNAILKYKPKDIYSVWDIERGKYDCEIKELDFNIELPDGTEKVFRYRCIVPNRPFCYMVGFSAIEGNENFCIAEIKHRIYKGELEENKNPTWDLFPLPNTNEKYKLPELVLDSDELLDSEHDKIFGKISKRSMNTMPSKLEIYNHWKDWLDKNDVPKFYETHNGEITDDDKVNSKKKLYFCFACGRQRSLDRAHIEPYNGGENDVVENIHLLCKRCHDESEFLSGDAYFDWIKNKKSFFHDVLDMTGFFIEYLRKNNLTEEICKKINDATDNIINEINKLDSREKELLSEVGDIQEKRKKLIEQKELILKNISIEYYEKYNPIPKRKII